MFADFVPEPDIPQFALSFRLYNSANYLLLLSFLFHAQANIYFMRDQVRFTTTLFQPPVEQSENGAALAHWLCAKLPASFEAACMEEDWGYLIEFASPRLSPHKIIVGCSHVEDQQWSIAIMHERSFFDKILKRPLPVAELREIITAIDEVIADKAAFSEIEWFENDERLQERNHGVRAFEN